jgi:hypothetical protein
MHILRCEKLYLLAYNATESTECELIFRKNILLHHLGLTSMLNRKPAISKLTGLQYDKNVLILMKVSCIN